MPDKVNPQKQGEPGEGNDARLRLKLEERANPKIFGHGKKPREQPLKQDKVGDRSKAQTRRAGKMKRAGNEKIKEKQAQAHEDVDQNRHRVRVARFG